MNTVEFKSATFPNAGSRHLLDDSVMESHSPTRGQAESSTLSSGISLGKVYAHVLIAMTHSLYLQVKCSSFFSDDLYVCVQGAARALSSVKRCLGQRLKGKFKMSMSAVLYHHILMKKKSKNSTILGIIVQFLKLWHQNAAMQNDPPLKLTPQMSCPALLSSPTARTCHASSLHRYPQMLLLLRQPEMN